MLIVGIPATDFDIECCTEGFIVVMITVVSIKGGQNHAHRQAGALLADMVLRVLLIDAQVGGLVCPEPERKALEVDLPLPRWLYDKTDDSSVCFRRIMASLRAMSRVSVAQVTMAHEHSGGR